LMEETGVPGENHWPAISYWHAISHNVVSSTPDHEWDPKLTTLGVEGEWINLHIE
jgi:hypothetical protein